jgi:hypothetical protein
MLYGGRLVWLSQVLAQSHHENATWCSAGSRASSAGTPTIDLIASTTINSMAAGLPPKTCLLTTTKQDLAGQTPYASCHGLIAELFVCPHPITL